MIGDKTMKIYTIKISLLAFCSIAYMAGYIQAGTSKQSNIDISKNDSVRYEVDTFRIAILPLEQISVFQIFKDVASAKLVLKEYEEVDNLLKSCITDYNKGQQSEFKINLSNYYRQYIVVTNSEGEKEVWINCFCDNFYNDADYLDWKKYVVFMLDGGKCFFNLKINLAKRQYYDLRVNGYA